MGLFIVYFSVKFQIGYLNKVLLVADLVVTLF